MEQLAKHRQDAWKRVRNLHQQIVREERAGIPHYCSLPLVEFLKQLTVSIERLETTAANIHKCFHGLVETVWINEYLNDRLVPIKEQYEALKKRFEILNQ